MSGIRRQSLISSAVIYAGFAVGLLNVYLFTKEGIFQKEQFGLYNAFIAVALMMMAFSGLGMPATSINSSRIIMHTGRRKRTNSFHWHYWSASPVFY